VLLLISKVAFSPSFKVQVPISFLDMSFSSTLSTGFSWLVTESFLATANVVVGLIESDFCFSCSLAVLVLDCYYMIS